MVWSEGGLSITFNGEIYNFLELKSELEKAGHSFKSHGDTEVILHLFKEYGLECLQKLRGMFSIALYDESSRELILARDPFGIKPLYWARTQDTVWFASLSKSLLRCPGVDTTPDAAGHVSFFAWGNLPATNTLYKGITQVPAGTALVIGSKLNEVREHRYFDIGLEAGQLLGEAASMSPPEAHEKFSYAVRDTITHHFVSDVPVGIFLSAGKDSTAMLACAMEVLKEPPRCVTLGFDEFMGTANDEVPLASEVASYYGAPHHIARIVGREFNEERESVFNAMDVPTVDGINTYYVSKVTHLAGLKVALSGLGADEFLCGYPSFDQIPKLVGGASTLSWIPGVGKGFRLVTSSMIKSRLSPKYAGLIEYGSSYGGAYLLRRGLFMPWELPSVMDPDMAREGWERLAPVATINENVSGIKDPQLRVSIMELTNYMHNRLLRDSDWASMAHSLEVRVPFVDVEFWRETVRFFGTQNRRSKADLLAVPSRPLPSSVANRPKSGFMVPVTQWISGESEDWEPENSLRKWAKIVYRQFTEVGSQANCAICT
jgi:asparagine synthase (glutamine-hydrolysing)